MLEVLVLLKSAKTPSSRIRFRNLEDLLRQRGVNCAMEFLPGGIFARRRLFRRAGEFPVTVLQKRLLSAPAFAFLRRHARILVFDFDDAICCRDASPSPDPEDYRSATRERKFARTVRGADFVIAANRELAARAGAFATGKPVAVIPSPVDVAAPPKDDYRLGSPPVLGWVGTRSSLCYLEYLAPALAELRRRRKFVLRVVADAAPRLPGIDLDFVPWRLDRQEEVLRTFDLGLMPLSPDPYAAGKSAYKLLQYLALGIPAVASPVGMNGDVAGPNEEYCLLGATPTEFVARCELLLADESLRRSLGQRGREKVAAEFSREHVADRLAEALQLAAG